MVQWQQEGDHISFYQSGNDKNKKGGRIFFDRAKLQCYRCGYFDGNYANECPNTEEESECLNRKGHREIGGS